MADIDICIINSIVYKAFYKKKKKRKIDYYIAKIAHSLFQWLQN